MNVHLLEEPSVLFLLLPLDGINFRDIERKLITKSLSLLWTVSRMYVDGRGAKWKTGVH